MKTVTLTFDLSDNQAEAFAQFCKRSYWDTFRLCAVDDAEAYAMIAAITQAREALANAGYAPR